MNKCSLMILAFSVGCVFSAPNFAASEDVDDAVELAKQSHVEQCQKRKIQMQMLIAHQSHDQDKQGALDDFESELEAINKSIKSTEEELNLLVAKINENPDDQGAYAVELMKIGDCE